VLKADASKKKGEMGKEPHPCKCTRSKCLKLYCDCFATSRYCDGCKCVGCYNRPTHEKERNEAIEAALAKNSKAFMDKIITQKTKTDLSVIGVHNSGCHCKRSNCIKKYCECFENNVSCGDKCKCNDCKNTMQHRNSPSFGQKENSNLNIVPNSNAVAPGGGSLFKSGGMGSGPGATKTKYFGTGGASSRRMPLTALCNSGSGRNLTINSISKTKRKACEDNNSSRVGAREKKHAAGMGSQQQRKNQITLKDLESGLRTEGRSSGVTHFYMSVFQYLDGEDLENTCLVSKVWGSNSTKAMQFI
jgi:hypothetical protein